MSPRRTARAQISPKTRSDLHSDARFGLDWSLGDGSASAWVYTQSMKITKKSASGGLAYLVVLTMLTGCELQQRRVDVPNASGADESLEERFGLTDDAQDPSERDAEMGYGRWKAKPEPEGTAPPTSPSRRGSWTGSP